MAVNDTQCGAELFRVTLKLVRTLATHFRSERSFGVHLGQRLMDGAVLRPRSPWTRCLRSHPEQWIHVAGSAVDMTGHLGARWDAIGMKFGRRQPRSSPPRAAVGCGPRFGGSASGLSTP